MIAAEEKLFKREMNPYSYPGGVPPFNLRLKQMRRTWLCHSVDFPTAYPARYKENDTAYGEYFHPRKGGSAPLAILLHGIGDHSVIPCRLLARALVNRGIACFILYMAFHSSRMPEVMRQRFPALTAEEWFEGYQISVINVRQVVDWATSRPEIDKGQIGVIGISFGGFISAIAMGIDQRIKAGVLLVAAGNSEKSAG